MLGLSAKSCLDFVQLYPLGLKFSIPESFSFQVSVQTVTARGTRSAEAGAAKHPEICWGGDDRGRCPSSEQQMSFQRASSLFPAVSAGLIRENDFVWPALRKKISHSSGKLSHRQLVEQGHGVLPSPVPRRICRNLAGDVEK